MNLSSLPRASSRHCKPRKKLPKYGLLEFGDWRNPPVAFKLSQSHHGACGCVGLLLLCVFRQSSVRLVFCHVCEGCAEMCPKNCAKNLCRNCVPRFLFASDSFCPVRVVSKYL